MEQDTIELVVTNPFPLAVFNLHTFWEPVSQIHPSLKAHIIYIQETPKSHANDKIAWRIIVWKIHRQCIYFSPPSHSLPNESYSNWRDYVNLVVFSMPRGKFLLISLKLSSKSFPFQLNVTIRRLTSTHDTVLSIGKWDFSFPPWTSWMTYLKGALSFQRIA